MAMASDFRIVKIKRNYRLTDSPYGKINRAAKVMKYLPLKNFFTYQYVVLLRKNS